MESDTFDILEKRHAILLSKCEQLESQNEKLKKLIRKQNPDEKPEKEEVTAKPEEVLAPTLSLSEKDESESETNSEISPTTPEEVRSDRKLQRRPGKTIFGSSRNRRSARREDEPKVEKSPSSDEPEISKVRRSTIGRLLNATLVLQFFRS